MAVSSSSVKQYVVRFEGNSSKQWDGKQIWIDAAILDELYKPSELSAASPSVLLGRARGERCSNGTLFLLIQ